MRKVKFKKWIPIQHEIGTHIRVKGTGQAEDEFKNEGLFHQWCPDYEEFDNGPANYIVALVELKDGTVVKVMPENLKFDKDDK